MAVDRRTFIASSAAVALGSALPGCASLFGERRPKMNVLVMGGTAFLGPHCVNQLLAHGHTVTLFNRGKTNPTMFPELEKIVGDRRDNVKALEGRKFDAVLDTNGYFPQYVRTPLEVLKDNVGQYLFVSTCSVYPHMGEVALDETSEVAEISVERQEEVTKAGKVGADYGAMKVACERAAEALMPGRVVVVRPGLIVGPDDATDRFTYWPARVQGGGEVLAPGKPEWEIQFTDVRDVAGFCVLALEKALRGTYNVDGLEHPVALGKVLETCKAVTKSDATFTWVDVPFLAAHDVQPWRDMPAWFPPPEGQDQVPPTSCKKAIDAGLTFLPLEETVKSALEFHAKRPADAKPKWTMTREREAEVLKAWHAR